MHRFNLGEFFAKEKSCKLAGIFLVPAFLALTLLVPSVSATDPEPATSSSTASSTTTVTLVNTITVRILDSTGASAINSVSLPFEATPGGSFNSSAFNVEVSTNNATGYKLYLSTNYQIPETSTYTTDLVNQTITSFTIPTLASNVSATDFSTGASGSLNHWGYSLDDVTFKPVPTHSNTDQIDYLGTPTATNLTPVSIGANVNMSKASGAYKNQLILTAIAEAPVSSNEPETPEP